MPRLRRSALRIALAMLVATSLTTVGLAADDHGDWQVLVPTEVKSSADSTFTPQEDGSLLVGGPEPDKDVYTIVADTPDTPVVALRLEALPDASLPRSGAGRSANTNFCVTEVELEVLAGHRRRATSVRFGIPFATRGDKGTARRAADGDRGSYWVVHGSAGEPSTLVLPLAEPVRASDGARLRVTIRQESGHRNHGLGRFRLATTSSQEAVDAYRPDLGPLSKRVDTATWRGIQFLLARQHPDGTWFSAQETERHLGMTALCAYALAKAGVPEEHAALQRALAYLETHPAHETYDASLRVLWHTSADPVGRRTLIERAARVLALPSGRYYDYSSPEYGGAGDLSNHQFAVVALHALDTHGFEIDRRAWEKLTAQVATNQNSDRGWGYRTSGATTPTMALAGLAVAAACRNAVVRNGAKARLVDRAEAAVSGALVHVGQQWLLEQPRTKAPLDRWFYYACYGMERAAALAGVTHFEEHDWYDEVATLICDEQADNGSWKNPWGEKERMTAFCLLTLARATASTGVPSIPARFEHRWSNSGDDGDLGVTVAGAPEARAYVAEFGADAVARLVWPDESRPRVTAVQWLLDDQPIGPAVAGDAPDAPAEGPLPNFAVPLSLGGNGDHTVVAVATVVPPDGQPVEIRSAPLAVEVRGLVDGPVLAAIERVRRAQLPADLLVAGSTEENGGELAAHRAFDRSESTRWLARADDTEPTLRASWKRPVKVAEIRLLPALHADHMADGRAYDVPRRVLVTLNGKDERVLAIAEGEMLSGATIALDKPVSLRRIEIRIVERDRGPHGGGRAGWREIQLLAPR